MLNIYTYVDYNHLNGDRHIILIYHPGIYIYIYNIPGISTVYTPEYQQKIMCEFNLGKFSV